MGLMLPYPVAMNVAAPEGTPPRWIDNPQNSENSSCTAISQNMDWRLPSVPTLKQNTRNIQELNGGQGMHPLRSLPLWGRGGHTHI